MTETFIEFEGTLNLLADLRRQTLPIEEVSLQVDTTNQAAIINLPVIANLGGFLNLKVIINDVNDNAAANNITINAQGGDVINAGSDVSITDNGGTRYIIIAGKKRWMAMCPCPDAP